MIYLREVDTEYRGLVIVGMLALALSRIVYLIHAHFLVPTRHGQYLSGGREDKIGHGILGRLVDSDILGQVALGVC